MRIEVDDETFAKACALQKKGEYVLAIQAFRGIYQMRDKDFDVILHLGECHWHLKKWEQALKYFSEATNLFPESEYASKSVFFTLWKLDRKVEAVEEIRRFSPFGQPKEYTEILDKMAGLDKPPD